MENRDDDVRNNDVKDIWTDNSFFLNCAIITQL